MSKRCPSADNFHHCELLEGHASEHRLTITWTDPPAGAYCPGCEAGYGYTHHAHLTDCEGRTSPPCIHGAAWDRVCPNRRFCSCGCPVCLVPPARTDGPGGGLA